MQNETNIPEADEPRDALAEDAEAEESQEEIQRLYEQSLKDIKEGEIVKGKVIQVDRDFVVVDIGYKSEGLIPINEFIDEKQNLNVEVGNEVDVLLERKEDEDGIIVLSKDKADKIPSALDVLAGRKQAALDAKLLHGVGKTEAVHEHAD